MGSLIVRDLPSTLAWVLMAKCFASKLPERAIPEGGRGLWESVRTPDKWPASASEPPPPSWQRAGQALFGGLVGSGGGRTGNPSRQVPPGATPARGERREPRGGPQSSLERLPPRRHPPEVVQGQAGPWQGVGGGSGLHREHVCPLLVPCRERAVLPGCPRRRWTELRPQPERKTRRGPGFQQWWQQHLSPARTLPRWRHGAQRQAGTAGTVHRIPGTVTLGVAGGRTV